MPEKTVFMRGLPVYLQGVRASTRLLNPSVGGVVERGTFHFGGSMFRPRLLGFLIGVAGMASLASGCVVRARGTTSAHVQGSAHVDTGSVVYVNAYPPEPQYEVVTASPGAGYVWIDGYWDWRGGSWVWVNGHWQAERVGYVYISS